MKRIALGIVWLAVASAAFGADWPQWGGPNRNGASPESGLMTTWPEGGPKVLWTTNVGQGYGGAAIEGDRAYLLDRQGDQDILRCLNMADGSEVWRYAYDAPGEVSHAGSRHVPTVGEKLVFSVGGFGQVTAFDKATGRPAWSHHLLKDYGGRIPRWGVAQSPLLYKTAVLLAPQSGSVGVVAYDQATGREVWRTGPVGEMGYASLVPMTVGGVDQAVLVNTAGVTSVACAGGQTLWSFAWRGRNPIPSAVQVGESGVFATNGYGAGSVMIAVRREGRGFAAREVWRHGEIGSHIQQPVLVGAHLYALCNTNSRADGLVCFRATDGTVAWQTERDPYLCKGGYILTGDGVFYLVDGRTGHLRIIQPDPAGYREVSAVPMLGGKGIWAPPALSDGRLVIRDASQMKCLDVRKP